MNAWRRFQWPTCTTCVRHTAARCADDTGPRPAARAFLSRYAGRQRRTAGQASIRIDSVHLSDQDGVKRLYHINAVDCITRFEIVATCERLSEAFLLPVIKTMLDSFPFSILGFHADNGSEYINHTVAELLDKLRVEFTKSRPRRSNDNGLAETKNGAIVRKHLGYSHIAQSFAHDVNAFCRDFLNPYVNFHRPCFFPESPTDAKGKTRKRYRFEDMITSYEKRSTCRGERLSTIPLLAASRANSPGVQCGTGRPLSAGGSYVSAKILAILSAPNRAGTPLRITSVNTPMIGFSRS